MARLSRVGAGEATTCLRVGSSGNRCLNFSDPFGLCHTITDEEEKKKCKPREASEQEEKDIQELERTPAAHEDEECWDAGVQVRTLRTNNLIRFYDYQFGDFETGLLSGDVLKYKSGAIAQIHVYSFQGSPQGRRQRSLGVKAGTLHEARHTMSVYTGREYTDPEIDAFVKRCTGIVSR